MSVNNKTLAETLKIGYARCLPIFKSDCLGNLALAQQMIEFSDKTLWLFCAVWNSSFQQFLSYIASYCSKILTRCLIFYRILILCNMRKPLLIGPFYEFLLLNVPFKVCASHNNSQISFAANCWATLFLNKGVSRGSIEISLY